VHCINPLFSARRIRPTVYLKRAAEESLAEIHDTMAANIAPIKPPIATCL